jgi:hypothetical protein
MGSDPGTGRLAAMVRQSWAGDLKTLAAIADSPTAGPAVRKDAQAELERWLLRFKTLGDNPNTPSEVQRDIETALRKFRHS